MNVYIDNASTTKICDSAKNAMNNSMEYFWGNPSSIHSIGREANEILDASRKTIAECINAQPKEIYFTSGGTESNNLAINSVKNGHIITTQFEHDSILNTVKRFDNTVFLPISNDGFIELYTLYGTISRDTKLVSVMMANNEIGTIQPIKSLAEICRYHHIPFHTDAVQAIGHIPVDVQDLGVDMLSASAHKFGGPRGVGFLYIRSGVEVNPILFGGGQEKGIRSGTENLPGIVGMATALKESAINIKKNNEHVRDLRDMLWDGIKSISGVHLNGGMKHRLSGNLNVSFDGLNGNGEGLLVLLDQYGIAVSTGSACSSASNEPSHVLKSIGLSDELAKSSIRFSLSHLNTEKEIEYIIEVLPRVIEFLKEKVECCNQA